MEFPEPFATLLNAFAVTRLNLISMFSVECISPGLANYHSQVVVTSLIPIVFSALIWISYFVRKAMGGGAEKGGAVAPVQGDAEAAKGAGGGGATVPASDALFSEHMHYFLFVSYLCLPAVAMAQFKGLNCATLEGDQTQYLRVEPDIICTEAAHKSFLGVNWPLILCYQILPISWVVLLAMRSHELNPRASDVETALKVRDKDPKLAHLRFLFVEYNGSQWYWDIVDIYRRITFISLMPFFGKGAARTGVGCCLALLSVIIYREACPYQNGSTNVLAVTAQYQILVTFLGAMLIQLSSITDEFFEFENNMTLGVFLFVSNLVVVGE